MSEEKPSEMIVAGSDLPADKALAMISDMSKGNYVPRVDLLQSNSAARQQGIGNDGDFVFNGTQNLGKQFTCIVLDWRPHAIMFDDQQNLVAESFDPASETYKNIVAKERGPKTKNERPGSGAEFLVWLPDFGTCAIVPLMKTARRHIQPLYTLYTAKKPATISASAVTSGGNTWQSPVIQEFKGTLDATKAPLPEVVAEAVRMFKNTTPAEAKEAAPSDGRPR